MRRASRTGRGLTPSGASTVGAAARSPRARAPRARARSGALALVVLAIAALAACGGGSATDGAPPGRPAGAQPRGDAGHRGHAAGHADETRRLVWGQGWQLDVRPVFSGSQISAGTGTVTVDEWGGGPGRISYRFPAFTAPLVNERFIAQSEGLVRREPAEGTVAVAIPDRNRAVFTPPMFWPGGGAEARGTLIWLPLEALTALKEQREVPVEIAALPGGLTMRSEVAASPTVAKVRMTARGEGVLQVDGVQTRFPVLKLEDDLGSTYTLLDSPQNPLVVRFRFGDPALAAGRKLATGASSGYDVVAMRSGAR